MGNILVACAVVVPALAWAEQWGAPADGLRIALAVENRNVVVTFQNIQPDREMLLALGATYWYCSS